MMEHRSDGEVSPGIDIGEFGRCRLEYMKRERPEILEELITEGALQSYLRTYDEKAREMVREVEGILAKDNPVLCRKKEHEILEIVMERRIIRNSAVNIVKNEFINR